MSRTPRPLPQPLQLAQAQFDDWRSTRQSRTIPEPLWSLAIEMAIEHGSFRTAKALRLNSDTLKKRLDGVPGKSASKSPRSRSRRKPSAGVIADPAFIAVDPIPPPARTLTGEGSVEFETAAGARMRIEWRRGEAPPDLLALGRSLFGGAR